MKPFLKLKHLWEELDMNQTDAAHAAGISESTLSTRITGKQPFTMWEVAKLCLLLNIPREEIHDYFMPMTIAKTAE